MSEHSTDVKESSRKLPLSTISNLEELIVHNDPRYEADPESQRVLNALIPLAAGIRRYQRSKAVGILKIVSSKHECEKVIVNCEEECDASVLEYNAGKKFRPLGQVSTMARWLTALKHEQRSRIGLRHVTASDLFDTLQFLGKPLPPTHEEEHHLSWQLTLLFLLSSLHGVLHIDAASLEASQFTAEGSSSSMLSSAEGADPQKGTKSSTHWWSAVTLSSSHAAKSGSHGGHDSEKAGGEGAGPLILLNQLKQVAMDLRYYLEPYLLRKRPAIGPLPSQILDKIPSSVKSTRVVHTWLKKLDYLATHEFKLNISKNSKEAQAVAIPNLALIYPWQLPPSS